MQYVQNLHILPTMVRRTAIVLRFRRWDLESEALTDILPLLCDPDLDKVKRIFQDRMT